MRLAIVSICLAAVMLPQHSLAQIREETGRISAPHPPQQDPGWRLGHTRDISTIAFAPDGLLIATCSDDNTIRLWRTDNGVLYRTIDTQRISPCYISFTPDGGEVLASFEKGVVGLWNVKTGALLTRVSGVSWDIGGMCWLPDRKHFVTSNIGGKIDVIDMNLRVVRELHTASKNVSICAIADNGHTVIYTPQDSDMQNGKSRAINMATGKRVKGWHDSIKGEPAGWPPSSVLILDEHPDDRHIVHRVKSGATVRGLNLKRDSSLTISASGKTALMTDRVERTSANVARLFSVETGRPIGSTFDAEYAGRVALSPDGSLAAIVDGQQSNRFRLFSTHTGKIIWGSADPTYILASKPTMPLLKKLSDVCERYGIEVPIIKSARSVIEAPSASTMPAHERHKFVEQELAALRKSAPAYQDPGPYSAADEAFPVACYRAGWRLLAMDLLTRKLVEFRGDVIEHVALAQWVRLEDALVTPKSDRAAVGVLLRRIFDDFPQLRTEHKKALISDLELSIASTGHKRDSIEGEIDELATEESKQINLVVSRGYDVEESSTAAKALHMRGFDAVPTLIKHIDDMRLTRCTLVGMDRYPNHIATVGELVTRLLAHLAGNYRISDPNRTYSNTDSREYANQKLVTDWWRLASAKPEEQYLVDNILPEKDDVNSEPNNANADLLAARYPARLPEVYIKLITSFSHIRSSSLSQILAEHRVGGKETQGLLVRAATSGGADQRQGAFWALESIKYPRTAELLAARLDALPAKADGEYWRSEPGNLTSIVRHVDEAVSWAALSRLARRSVLGQKLSIICELKDPCVCSDPNVGVIHFLLPFVEDHTQCNLKTGDLADSGFMITGLDMDRISISDAALMGIGDQFKINSFSASSWTASQWAAFRVNVKSALEKWQKNTRPD